MARINGVSKLNNNTIIVDETSSLIINKDILNKINKIVVKSLVKCDILFSEIDNDFKVELDAEDGSNVFIKGLINGESVNVEFNTNNRQNSEISMHFVDFSSKNSNILATSYMNEEGASFIWQMASLAASDDNKKVHVNVKHNATHLYGDVSNYGVCKDVAKLEIAGTTHIANGANKTITKQNARVMLIDEHSRGIAKPILKIDENDVKASHGASLGQINEEHLYYLKSRGLSESDAKKLIVLGYFNPVILLFKDEECEEYILNLVGERI